MFIVWVSLGCRASLGEPALSHPTFWFSKYAMFAFSLARLLCSAELTSAAIRVSGGGVVTQDSRLGCRVWACAQRRMLRSEQTYISEACSLASKESGLPGADVGEAHQGGLPLPLLVYQAHST